MYEFNGLNPDVMRAELAYRRERMGAHRRTGSTGRGPWRRALRRPARPQNG
ncbi:MAG: hypothetical protein ABR604_05515 [Jatrophihabitantaceae bacterium]